MVAAGRGWGPRHHPVRIRAVRENEVWGPIAYMETTTSLRLNPENTSRWALLRNTAG